MADPIIAVGKSAVGIEYDVNALGRLAEITRPLLGRKIGFLGDSITNRSTADVSNRAFPDQTLEMLGVAAAPFGSGSVLSGHPGATSDQIAPYLISDIIAGGCKHVIMLEGTNDAGSLVPVATYADNMLAQFEVAKRAGLGLTVLTVPPRGTNASPTSAQNTLIDAYNAWLRVIVPKYGFLVDVRTALQDPTASLNRLRGIYDSGDGVHPNSLGHWTMAVEIARVLRVQFKRPQILDGFSAFNLISNPYFFGSSATGWYERPSGTGTAPTYSYVTDATGALNKGVFREMDFAPGGTSGNRAYATVVSSGFSAGDTLAFTGKLQIEDPNAAWTTIGPGAAGTAYCQLEIFNGASGVAIPNSRPAWGLGFPSSTNIFDYGPLWNVFTVPSGVTSLELRMTVSLPAGGQLKSRLGEVGLLNLTANGMVGLI